MPAELPRRLDIFRHVVDEGDFAGQHAGALGRQPEEFPRWFPVSKGSGIQDVIEMRSKSGLFHQVARPPVLLVGRQKQGDAAVS